MAVVLALGSACAKLVEQPVAVDAAQPEPALAGVDSSTTTTPELPEQADQSEQALPTPVPTSISAAPVTTPAPDPVPASLVSLERPAPASQAIKADRLSVYRPNLWHHIRENMRWEYASNERIEAQLKWFARHPSYINRVVERSKPYLFHIVMELQKNDMPVELALLPVVESAFQPFAYSFGRATGLWQFIPSTGKAFGLKQNWWYDGRRDVVASTDAAIRFFTELHDEFSGDWLHALAAYNAGPAKVRRAIRRNSKKGASTSYWDLRLPRETHNYVPKLLAIVELVKNASLHQIELPPVETEPYFATVNIGAQLDLSRAAEMANTDIEELYLLNPGFNRWATAPDGPHRLLVPIDQRENFVTALRSLPEDQRISWTRHTIKPRRHPQHHCRALLDHGGSIKKG
ncbi:MAG: transglycosylase SLT domain-containing protein [Pseudomonadota bacterium]